LQRLSSLSARLVAAVVATATAAFATSYGLTFLRLDEGLKRQSEQLGRLSEERLGQKLDGEARLAGAQMERLFDTMGRRLEAFAQRADIVKVVASANVVPIWDLLGRGARSMDFDGFLVVDTRLRVYGADRDSLDMVATNQALQASPLAVEIRPILGDNDRKRPQVLRRAMPLTAELAKALGARSPAPLAAVLVEPIFDDFGDVFAALIVHRAIRASEPILEEFSRLEGAGLLLLDGHRSISSAGIADPTVSVRLVPGTTLLRTSDGGYWSRCAQTLGEWQICALAPVAELHALRDEMVRIGAIEGRSLATWLIIVAIVSLLCFALIMLVISRRISQPLARITEAVRAVARGDWKTEITEAGRRDEVGDIARAVIVLQRSLEERDRLRSDVAHAEAARQRREALEDAIRRFDRVMRSMLLRVSDSVETMDETARDLARMSAVAEGEAVETAFVSGSTVTNVATMRAATERLSTSISQTVEQIRLTSDMIGMSNKVAQSAFARAEHLAAAAGDIDAVVSVIADLAARTNALALDATVKAARSGGHPGFNGLVTDIRSLAERIAAAQDEAAQRLAGLRGASTETVDAVRVIAHKLDAVLQQTRTIALTMERQDDVSREIADTMSAAANGTVNVSSSVARLKFTIEEAKGASMKVVTKATDMADEACRLDVTVKSFLREVTA
jgi:methyl-accepting chemotaxis protein